jgi:hypothetical protein
MIFWEKTPLNITAPSVGTAPQHEPGFMAGLSANPATQGGAATNTLMPRHPTNTTPKTS